MLAVLVLASLALASPARPCSAAGRSDDARRSPSPTAADAAAGPGAVWVTKVKGIIDPALAGYLVDTMEQAAEAQAAALVIQLDTPGGLDTAMRDIIQAEIDSPIPIVFYVYPQGARAASAGVYILMGSDVAAMAPQTNLGAATPVSLSGDMDETMQAKVTNDAAAYIIGLAETHGRNAEWAEKAVREAVSLPAEDALDAERHRLRRRRPPRAPRGHRRLRDHSQEPHPAHRRSARQRGRDGLGQALPARHRQSRHRLHPHDHRDPGDHPGVRHARPRGVAA